MLDSLKIRNVSGTELFYDVYVNGVKLNHVQSVSLYMEAMNVPVATITFHPGTIETDVPNAMITEKEEEDEGHAD